MMMRPLVTRIIAGSLLGAALLAGLAFLAAKEQPPIGAVPLLTPEGRTFWLVALAVCVIGAAVFQVLDRIPQVATATAPRRAIRYDPVPEWPTGWVLPFGTLAAGSLLLCAYNTTLAGMAVVFFGFIALLVGQLARLALYSAEARTRTVGRVAHTVLLYGLAFVAFAMVYVHKLRSLYSATAI
ncbi:MAG: hypothetical protein ACK42I_02995, partial [Thermomicrobium sp.]